MWRVERLWNLMALHVRVHVCSVAVLAAERCAAGWRTRRGTAGSHPQLSALFARLTSLLLTSFAPVPHTDDFICIMSGRKYFSVL